MRLPISRLGLDCSDVWFDLIDELCNTIENTVKNRGLKTVKLTQVSSVGGGLYLEAGLNDDSEAVHEVIWYFMERSFLQGNASAPSQTLGDSTLKFAER